ncbi:TonB-dependent receptor [Lysobacter rhizosphaerae]
MLKDGASTIYGSDAIAGVVNVILRQDFDGAEANAYIGSYTKGDGSRQSYDVTIGSSSDRWNAMLGVAYVKEDPVKAGDREISAVPLFGAINRFRYSSTTPDGRFRFAGKGAGTDFTADGKGGFRPYVGANDSYNFAPDNYLVTPQERASIFASGGLNIADDLRFKITTQYNNRKSEQLLAAMPVTFGRAAPGTNAANILISKNSIYNPTGKDVDYGARRVTETGGRSFNQNVTTSVFNPSFEGTLTFADKPFDWEAGYLYGVNTANNTTYGLFSVPALRNALGPSYRDAAGNAHCGTVAAPIDGCVPMNFLGGEGTISREMLDYATFTAHDEFQYKLKTYYADISGELFDIGNAGAFAFSFGLEHRTESGYDSPDALINSGDTTGNARTATRGGYSLDEAYLELAIPVLADVPGAKLLDFSVATRYSDYSNFGDTLNSKFGFRWKPFDDLMIRGNWSQGFRAPSVAEMFSGIADSFPTIADPCAGFFQGAPNPSRPASCAGIPAYDQPNAQVRISTGGNPNLQPETSTSTTFGFVYSPSWAQGLDISLDWWKINLDDAILTVTGQTVLDHCYRAGDAASCALISRTSSGEISDLLAGPLNIGKFVSEGYDITVGYRLPETAWGKFSFTWDTSYLSKFTQDLDGDGVVTDDEGGNQAGEYSQSSNNWRIRSNLATRWERGDWGATWNARYYSRQEEDCSAIPAVQQPLVCNAAAGARPQNKIGARVYNDASVYWNAPWNAKVTLGVNNILDQDPPSFVNAFANSFDPQYEIPGRFVYMQYKQVF